MVGQVINDAIQAFGKPWTKTRWCPPLFKCVVARSWFLCRPGGRELFATRVKSVSSRKWINLSFIFGEIALGDDQDAKLTRAGRL